MTKKEFEDWVELEDFNIDMQDARKIFKEKK